MNWIMVNADLLSGFFGLLAAIALGWPAFRAVRAKRYWEKHRRLSKREGLNEENVKQLAVLSGRVDALQLAGSRDARICNLIGALCLGLAFISLLLAGIERRSGEEGPAVTVANSVIT